MTTPWNPLQALGYLAYGPILLLRDLSLGRAIQRLKQEEGPEAAQRFLRGLNAPHIDLPVVEELPEPSGSRPVRFRSAGTP